MEEHIGAEAFIEVLNTNGVENIFFNPGGEQASIQATVAKYRVEGKKCPRLVLCLDEAVAMTAAYGHYLASGQPQAVMVHAELGTLQIGGAWHNAQRSADVWAALGIHAGALGYDRSELTPAAVGALRAVPARFFA